MVVELYRFYSSASFLTVISSRFTTKTGSESSLYGQDPSALLHISSAIRMIRNFVIDTWIILTPALREHIKWRPSMVERSITLNCSPTFKSKSSQNPHCLLLITMSDANSTRIPGTLAGPYSAENADDTLTRGKKWAQVFWILLFDVLMSYASAFVNWPVPQSAAVAQRCSYRTSQCWYDRLVLT